MQKFHWLSGRRCSPIFEPKTFLFSYLALVTGICCYCEVSNDGLKSVIDNIFMCINILTGK